MDIKAKIWLQDNAPDFVLEAVDSVNNVHATAIDVVNMLDGDFEIVHTSGHPIYDHTIKALSEGLVSAVQNSATVATHE